MTIIFACCRDRAEYLLARGWKLYRERWEGKPAQYISPHDKRVYALKDAFRTERALEKAHYETKR